MKKLIFSIVLFVIIFGMSGCAQKRESDVITTFEQTPPEVIEEYMDNSKEVITTTYYELNDGTWKTDDYAYKYRLVITGRVNNAVKDTSYTVLSNTENITFDQAWKASGLSSNIHDYFDPETAVIVASNVY